MCNCVFADSAVQVSERADMLVDMFEGYSQRHTKPRHTDPISLESRFLSPDQTSLPHDARFVRHCGRWWAQFAGAAGSRRNRATGGGLHNGMCWIRPRCGACATQDTPNTARRPFTPTHNACTEPPRSPKPAVPSQLCYWTQKPTVDTHSSFCDGVDVFLDATSSAGRSVTRSVDDARGTSYCAFEVHGTDGLGHGATLTFRCSAVSEAQEWIHCIAINIEAHQARAAPATAAAAAPPPEPTAALAEAPAAYLEGFLYKTGALNKCWKRRWVTLHWDSTIPLQCIMYHRVHKAAVAKGGAERGGSLGGSSQLKPAQLKPAGVLLLPECSLSFPPSDKAQGARIALCPSPGPAAHKPSTSPARAQHELCTSSAPALHRVRTSSAPAAPQLCSAPQLCAPPQARACTRSSCTRPRAPTPSPPTALRSCSAGPERSAASFRRWLTRP